MALVGSCYANVESFTTLVGTGSALDLTLYMEDNWDLFHTLLTQHEFGLLTTSYWASCERAGDRWQPALAIEVVAAEDVALTLIFDQFDRGEARSYLPVLASMVEINATVIWNSDGPEERSFEMSFPCRPADPTGCIQRALSEI